MQISDILDCTDSKRVAASLRASTAAELTRFIFPTKHNVGERRRQRDRWESFRWVNQSKQTEVCFPSHAVLPY